jgi:hypothetical protein
MQSYLGCGGGIHLVIYCSQEMNALKLNVNVPKPNVNVPKPNINVPKPNANVPKLNTKEWKKQNRRMPVCGNNYVLWV